MGDVCVPHFGVHLEAKDWNNSKLKPIALMYLHGYSQVAVWV